MTARKSTTSVSTMAPAAPAPTESRTAKPQHTAQYALINAEVASQVKAGLLLPWTFNKAEGKPYPSQGFRYAGTVLAGGHAYTATVNVTLVKSALTGEQVRVTADDAREAVAKLIVSGLADHDRMVGQKNPKPGIYGAATTVVGDGSKSQKFNVAITAQQVA